ncbi:MAG TPA: SDR family oxidoreductase [Candidatus Binatia bacterium]|nr:SDR family oxidoreductase [Candidatus Binatia bacterium]
MSIARFADRTAYITGAGSGLGRATAQRFASEGARVFAADVNEVGIAETVAAIRQSGGVAAGGVCDVSRMDSVRTSIAGAVETFGGISILINAAGVGKSARLEEIDEAEWQRVIGVNLTGVFHTTKVAIEHLLKQPGGNIVNIASTAGVRGQAYNSHYAASKAGLLNFTKSIALEFVSRGLRANCVCPGGVMTPLLQHFIPRDDFEPPLMAYYMPPIPHKLGAPEDVAAVITFLASDEARMINGVALPADFGTLA